MAREIIKHIDVEQEYRARLGVEQIDLVFNSELEPGHSTLSRDVIKAFWGEGYREFIDYINSDEFTPDLCDVIDWSQDSFEFSDRMIAGIFQRTVQYKVRKARTMVRVGVVVDRASGVRKFTKEEFLLLVVAAHAFNVGMKTMKAELKIASVAESDEEESFEPEDDQTGAFSDFRHKNKPRF
ncbi:hypothetical protein HYZ78_02395 [Candidatus Microgenomates bacterium]|nr:hypothetical protein [Candidatus Microgenomates bacterium]